MTQTITEALLLLAKTNSEDCDKAIIAVGLVGESSAVSERAKEIYKTWAYLPPLPSSKDYLFMALGEEGNIVDCGKLPGHPTPAMLIPYSKQGGVKLVVGFTPYDRTSAVVVIGDDLEEGNYTRAPSEKYECYRKLGEPFIKVIPEAIAAVDRVLCRNQ